jgi:hypothetical protein
LKGFYDQGAPLLFTPYRLKAVPPLSPPTCVNWF